MSAVPPDAPDPLTRAGLAAAVHDETRSLIGEVLADADEDQLFDGVGSTALHTILGVALVHAALSRLDGDPSHRAAALHLSHRYLRERGRPRAWPRQVARLRALKPWNARETIEAGSTLAWVLLALAPSLSEAEAAPFRDVLARTYPVLRSSGGLRAYINGNYAVPLCELAYVWERVLGGVGHPGVYEDCWRLLVKPGSAGAQWDGYGWISTVAVGDGELDGEEGYFTETPGYVGPKPENAFDPEYAQLQLEHLVRLWLLTGDARALHYIEAIHRLLLRGLDRTSWELAFAHGSRNPGRTPFFSAATCLLALRGPRETIDLGFALEQFRRGVAASYRPKPGPPNPYLLRGYGLTLVPLLLLSAPAGAWELPVAPAPADALGA